MTAMQILYVALDCPLPANNGLHLRTLSILKALREEGCQVSLVCLQATSSPRSRATLLEICDSFWIVNHRVSSLSLGRDWRRVLSLASPLPFAVRRFRSTAARALLHRLCTCQRWDAIVCDTVFAAVNLPPCAAPLVLNHHNIEHRILTTYAAHEPTRLKRNAARWEGAKIQRWETRLGRRAALQLVCSTADRRWLLEYQPDARVAVVPNVVTPPGTVPAVVEDPDLILFPAALDWLPNRDAVEFFLHRIWPAVRAQAPQARFVAAGRNPPPAWLNRHRHLPDVEFTGTVPDMQPWLARAAVVVVPLRIGSGTRLKILEAACAAKPVVATHLGAEGLDLVHGAEILLASEPEDFAAAVVGLLAAPAQRRALGQLACERVRTLYSPSALRHSLREAFASLGPPAPAMAEATLQEVQA